MIAIIAALAKNRVIGSNGKIPWDLPEDRRQFQKRTMGHVIVMGRRTYEEIGHPLPGRKNYILSSTITKEPENCHIVHSLSEVLEKETGEDIFICGGEMLYKEALPVADRLYLTELEWEERGDTFFPYVPEGEFCEAERIAGEGDYFFVRYDKEV